MQQSTVTGAGLGLRRSFIKEIISNPPATVDFYEVAPENWVKAGGRFGKQFRQLTEQHQFVCHGLSLSLGSPAPLDVDFVRELKQFFATHGICHYSEHLSYCSDDGHLYDLMPIPFTQEAVSYVAARIRQVQDILEQPIAIENVSYYAAPGQEMTEIEFLLAVLNEAKCELLLDVNNIYVNSVNHQYNALEFLRALEGQLVRYMHVAGHYVEAEDLLVDTHASTVIDPVWELLAEAYRLFGVMPTLLERDFNIPELAELYAEVDIIHQLQETHQLSAKRLQYA